MPKYQSCKWIEHGMVLDFMNTVRFCSNANPGHGGRPLIFENFCGENINWEEFFKYQNKIREKFRNGEPIEECKNCIGFECKEWNQENYIDELLITPWHECNSKCTYCGVHQDEYFKGKSKKYNVYNLVKNMVKNNILKKDGVMDFAGGEPTLSPYFEKTLNLFIDEGFLNIVVHTNAIKHSRAIEKGIKKGAVNILVSIDAGTKEVHEKVKGVKTFDKVWKNLKTYAKVQQKPYRQVKAKFIVVPGINDTKEEIDLWLQSCFTIGIKYVVLNLDFNWLNKNIDNIDLNLYDLMKYTIAEAEKLGITCELYGQMFQLKSIVENSREKNEAGFHYNKLES